MVWLAAGKKARIRKTSPEACTCMLGHMCVHVRTPNFTQDMGVGMRSAGFLANPLVVFCSYRTFASSTFQKAKAGPQGSYLLIWPLLWAVI